MLQAKQVALQHYKSYFALKILIIIANTSMSQKLSRRQVQSNQAEHVSIMWAIGMSVVNGDFCFQARCFTDNTFRCCMNISVQNEPKLQINENFFSEPLRYAITANGFLHIKHSYFIWVKQNAIFNPIWENSLFKKLYWNAQKCVLAFP